MAIAKVEPLTTARAVRGPFDYRLPPKLGDVAVGSVLLVPFGRRRVLGVVVELAESSELPPERLAEPLQALEAGTPPELVRLGLWVAREYCSTPGRGLELVLPPGAGARGVGPAGASELLAELTPAGRAALTDGARLGSRQRSVLTALGDAGPVLSAGQLADRAGAQPDVLRRLDGRGLVRLTSQRRFRRPDLVAIAPGASGPRLNPSQRAAVAQVTAAMDGREERELLLCGVTGAGKTEVHLAATAKALERGRGAIVLVPEIGLTPQAMTRFVARFGDLVALLHSGLAAGQRRDEWERLRRGDARICVGPRSAVFAPVANLGLVVVDEEHETAYKQEGDPRYDARHVARRRAAQDGAALVLASATPRPESWAELRRVELPERVDGAALPDVEVLDMRARGPQSGPLHARTIEALAELRRDGGKGIVLLNRRGWSPFVTCRSCGRAWLCPHCDVSLVLHRRNDALRCHHCGHGEPMPESCPECESVTLARHGVGTERLGSLLQEILGPVPVVRLDSDTVARRGTHQEILRRFEEAPGAVLVGTQMVSKGHDFPDVSLAVVLDADATLRFPDFRAEERAFAMVSQLAGRAGRGPSGGRVLVQTLAPGASAIRFAASHDAPGFLDAELARRRALAYPPFAHLVRIELSGREEERIRAAADELRDQLVPQLPDSTELLGPAPMLRIRDLHRRQLLLKAKRRDETVSAVGDAVEALAAARRLRSASVSVDVDPQ